MRLYCDTQEAISQEGSGFDKVRRDQERMDWRMKEMLEKRKKSQ